MRPLGRTVFVLCTLTIAIALGVKPEPRTLGAGPSRHATVPDTVSFAQDVFPIIKQRCLPCHAEDNYNPSELSLDSYELLMEGGRHGEAVVPGKSEESNLVYKLLPDPSFGDRMPLDMRKKKGKKSTVAPLDEEQIQTIAIWIDQGAKDN